MSMSGHEGFRVESESIASVKDCRHLVDSHPVFQVESIVKPGYGRIFVCL